MKQTLYMHKDLSQDEVKTRLRSEGTRRDTKEGPTSVNLIQGKQNFGSGRLRPWKGKPKKFGGNRKKVALGITLVILWEN